MTESTPAETAAASVQTDLEIEAALATIDDDGDAPAIVAVCITSDAGDDFEECLGSLVAQDYPNLSILVIDAGNPQPIAARVAAVAPDAFLHRLQVNPGFSAAANQALTLVKNATFLLFCTDRVAFGPHTVSAMAEEMFRSNAGIVTTKYVEWDDPRRLVSVGMGADHYGVKVDLVEPREFDQEQHDGVRDVFVAPTGVQLVRRDLFTTLDGFDATMGSENEDLDLCWRAHVAGARIVVNPSTSVRIRVPAHDDGAPSRTLLRNRLRSLLVTSSRWTLVRSLPVAVLLVLAEAIGQLMSGKRSRAARIVGVLPSTLSDLGDIRARRDRMDAVRQIPDAEVRALQVTGSAQVSDFVRHRFGAGQDRLAGLVGSVRDNLAGDELTAQRVAALGGMLLALLGFFGSRSLLDAGVVPIGSVPQLPGGGTLLGEWWSGWRSAGTGGAHAAPILFFALGLLRLVFFWGTGVLDTFLVIGPLVLGAVGAWRLARPLGSPRAGIAAAFAYSLNPLPLAVLGAGRWQVLVIWGAAPFLLLSALRLQNVAPFESPHPLSVRLLRFGLLVAAVASASPTVVVLAVIIVVGLALGSILVARPEGVRALSLGVPVAVLVPIALHMPWSISVVADGGWSWVIGPSFANATFDSMADLVRFAPGLDGPGWLVFGAVIVAGGGLALGRGHRFDTAARGLTIAMLAWFLGWAGRRDYLGVDLPGVDALLCLAAVGVALAVAASVRMLDVDLDRRSRSVRVGAQSVVLVGMAMLTLLGFRSALDGRWNLPEQSHIGFAQILLDSEPEPVRTLWIGAPSVLPIDGSDSAGGIHFGVTEGVDIDLIQRYAPAIDDLDAEIGDRLDLVVAGQTDRLGRLLAAYGVDLVIVVPTLAPPPYDGPRVEAGNAIESVLALQLDLQRVSGTLGLRVYRNTASAGPARVADGPPPPVEIEDQLALDTSSMMRAPLRYERTGTWAEFDPTDVGVAQTTAQRAYVLIDGTGWVAGNDATSIVAADDHYLELQASGDAPAVAGYHSSTLGRLFLLLQLLLIAIALVLSQPERREEST